MYRIIKGHIDQRSTKRKWNFASDKFRITRVFPIVQASMDAASAFGPKVARLQEYTVWNNVTNLNPHGAGRSRYFDVLPEN